MNENMIEKNIIITEPSKNLRALGRNALRGKWKIAIIAVLIYMVCLTVPTAILDGIFGVSAGDVYTNQYGMNDNISANIYNSMPESSVIGLIYTVLVTGAFELGISMFFLANFRKQTNNPADIFFGFEKFGKALGLMLFSTLFVCLWTLLFIVPGIIAALRYSQAFFILADDPSKSIRQCMNESKAMMKGNKAKYFCLSLSFIGWAILSALPAAVLGAIAGALYAPAVIISIVTAIGALFEAPVTAYMYSTYTGFYEILAGHLIKETEPAPVEPVVPEIIEAPKDAE